MHPVPRSVRNVTEGSATAVAHENNNNTKHGQHSRTSWAKFMMMRTMLIDLLRARWTRRRNTKNRMPDMSTRVKMTTMAVSAAAGKHGLQRLLNIAYPVAHVAHKCL